MSSHVPLLTTQVSDRQSKILNFVYYLLSREIFFTSPLPPIILHVPICWHHCWMFRIIHLIPSMISIRGLPRIPRPMMMLWRCLPATIPIITPIITPIISIPPLCRRSRPPFLLLTWLLALPLGPMIVVVVVVQLPSTACGDWFTASTISPRLFFRRGKLRRCITSCCCCCCKCRRRRSDNAAA